MSSPKEQFVERLSKASSLVMVQKIS